MSDKFSEKSCPILHQLYRIIEQRRDQLPPDSYTTKLFQGGITKIVEKFAEESQELIDATKSKNEMALSCPAGSQAANDQVTHEAADLMYHFLVLLAACGVTFNDVEQELTRRFGVSGLAEKAARKKS